MIESAILQGLFKLCLLIVGLVAARITLMWLDRAIEKSFLQSGRSRFQDWYARASSQEKGIYYAARIAAVFIAVALVVG